MKSRFIWVALLLIAALLFSVTSHAKLSELAGTQDQVGISPSMMTASEKPSKDLVLQTETFDIKAQEKESKDTDWTKGLDVGAVMIMVVLIVFLLILVFQELFFWIIAAILIVAVLVGLNEAGLFDLISDILDKVKSFLFT